MPTVDVSSLTPDGLDYGSAINAAIAGGATVINVDGTFGIGTTISFVSKDNLTFTTAVDGGFVLLGTNYLMDVYTSDNLIIEHITIDGGGCWGVDGEPSDNGIASVRGLVLRGCKNLELDNITGQNFGNETITTSSHIVTIAGGGPNQADGPHIHDCTFKQVVAMPKSETGPGTGLYQSGDAACVVFGEYGGEYVIGALFEDCTFEDVYPVADGDGIKCLQTGVDNYLTVRNCAFTRCAKRGLKTQGNHTTSIGNTFTGSQEASIDFIGGTDNSSTDDVIVWDGTDAYVSQRNDNGGGWDLTYTTYRRYGMITGVSNCTVLRLELIDTSETRTDLFPIGVLFGYTDEVAGAVCSLKDSRIVGCMAPIAIMQNTVGSLTVDNNVFESNTDEGTIKSGGYFSGGVSFYPSIETLIFTSNRTIVADVSAYLGYIHYHLSSDHYSPGDEPGYSEHLLPNNDVANTHIVTGNVVLSLITPRTIRPIKRVLWRTH